MPFHHDLPHRKGWTLALLILQLVATVFHLFPRLVYPARPTTMSGIVALTEQVGPIWVATFGVTALALVLGLRFNRGLHWAHGVCMASWVVYAAVLFTGAVVAKGTYFYPAVVTGIALLHGVAAWFYNDDAGRQARRERR